MHKFIVSAITAIAMLSLTGCGKSQTTEQTPAETDTEEATAKAEAGMVLLEPDFPNPQFQGTQVPAEVPNLEKPGTKQPQLMVPEESVNLAAGKPVSGSDEFPIIGELDLITDGDKEGVEGSFVEVEVYGTPAE